ncbi:YAF2-like protein [Mya arenaria]|uniref:YAF2-like protein n=1 Tax=Mya arenaria TaxID=6604 RepID=A0ABY7FSB6_MYAAR|nr:YAF2-like protein [Mya arenaria]
MLIVTLSPNIACFSKFRANATSVIARDLFIYPRDETDFRRLESEKQRRLLMEEKRPSGRSKRPSKPPEDGSWDCSVCTYKNSVEAYKCEMCDVRKGTSTRFEPPAPPPKPVLKKEKSATAPAEPPTNLSKIEKGEKSSFNKNTLHKMNKSNKTKTRPPRLKNVDGDSGSQMAVTVDDVTVIITENLPKRIKLSTDISKHSDISDSSSNASNDIVEERLLSDNHG